MLLRKPWKWPAPRGNWTAPRGNWTQRFTGAWAIATAVSVAWTCLTPLSGPWISPDTLWAVEPAAYLGAAIALVSGAMTIAGLDRLRRQEQKKQATNRQLERRWQHLTEEFLRVFDHDLGRPMRRIYGKKRDLDVIIKTTGHEPIGAVTELIEEIEHQVPNYRLMLQNVQAMVNLEDTDARAMVIPTDAANVVGKTSDRYSSVARDAGKTLTWWEEDQETHMVSTDPNAMEHIIANLADNAVKHAASQVTIAVGTSPDEIRVEVSDDGPGIKPNHMDYIFERSWTPEVARREEKSSSGLGLHIARTMARRCGGDVNLTCPGGPGEDQCTVFTMTLPNLRH